MPGTHQPCGLLAYSACFLLKEDQVDPQVPGCCRKNTGLNVRGSNICYLSNSADSRGHENTGKGTRKADETGLSSEKEERRIEPDFEGREYRKQD